ncbi:MAG: hypothetical protein M9894_16245 [Planctomycetes bacterium]|nr:hypothetical protein [Planctomycetota bacterium]
MAGFIDDGMPTRVHEDSAAWLQRAKALVGERLTDIRVSTTPGGGDALLLIFGRQAVVVAAVGAGGLMKGFGQLITGGEG